MTGPGSRRTVAQLDRLVSALSSEDRARFERIYHLSTATGELVPPAPMNDWIAQHFGAVDTVRRQRVVKVTNRVTLEGALFNVVRSLRPLQAPPCTEDVADRIDSREGCDFCQPDQCTPADTFGRIEGQHCLTSANVAKYDGWHAVIVFDEHHPLHFTADQVAEYVDVGQRWAQAARAADPGARYPLFLWNCLWRSGASILHGHAQMVLTHEMHFAKVEGWRQAALRYEEAYGSGYFTDLIAVHHALGLAVEHGSATIVPSLTPFKEKETHIIAPGLNQDLKSALYWVLSTFIERLGVQSFNLALYQPPLAESVETWEHFPSIFRILDRGDLRSNTSDVGAMEFFAQSVVVTDPFAVADAIRGVLRESTP